MGRFAGLFAKKDDKKFIGEPGDVIFCKKGLTHKITVLSDEPCIRLAVCVDNQETIFNLVCSLLSDHSDDPEH